MVRDTIKVKEGLGNYRYDENLKEFVPDTDGNILLRTISTGEYIPVNNLKMGGEIHKPEEIYKKIKEVYNGN